MGIEDRLGYRFRNPQLLRSALTHRSALNQEAVPKQDLEDNERLEFLGDALLAFVVSHFLYQALPHASEGHLTMIKSRLVSSDTLARVADRLSLVDDLRLGKGEERWREEKKRSILAGAMEALIAAIFLDGGYLPVDRLLSPLLRAELEDLRTLPLLDAKSRLQVLVQSRGVNPPCYRVLTRKGPAHDPTFWVEVRVKGRILGKGKGRSKKEAEQEAAGVALSTWCTDEEC